MTVNIDSVDVLVWGGGTGGAAAAIQAAVAVPPPCFSPQGRG